MNEKTRRLLVQKYVHVYYQSMQNTSVPANGAAYKLQYYINYLKHRITKNSTLHTCIHIHKHTYRLMHVNLNIYTHADIDYLTTYIPAYVHMFISTDSCIHTFIYAYMQTYLDTCIHTYRLVHIFIHTFIIYINMYKCTHIIPDFPYFWNSQNFTISAILDFHLSRITEMP